MLAKVTDGFRVNATSDGQIPVDAVVQHGVRANQTDVGVLASQENDQERVRIFTWHYHHDDLPKPDAQVNVKVTGLDGRSTANLTYYRVDQEHSNSYTTWLRTGSPQSPTDEQYTILKSADDLAVLSDPESVNVSGGTVQVSFELPIHALSLIVLARQ